MSDMDNWQHQQFADECARISQIIDALEEAERKGVAKDALDVLALETGVYTIYKKGAGHEPQ